MKRASERQGNTTGKRIVWNANRGVLLKIADILATGCFVSSPEWLTGFPFFYDEAPAFQMAKALCFSC